ncbi:MAG TPA: glycosyltransferase family A protein [Candidatus Peribacteraceae bacterium]|nr:glycosyltransferase family A protein [Candidatus Peribacteraceae bacterium]
MKVSIVIPAYNEERYLGACLQSIVDHDNENLLEVIVVDNKSTDHTDQITREFNHHKVRLICEPTKGPNFARQAGFKEAKGEIIATIDADTRVPDGWFEELQKVFSNPKVVGLSGPYDYYDLPFIKRTFVYILWKYLGMIAHVFTGFVVYGGNFAGRKSALDKIGGFDANIVFYGDDANTGRRLHHIGKVLFDPRFYIWTSARRLKAQGIARICWIYGVNFISEAVSGKPWTPQHKDFR